MLRASQLTPSGQVLVAGETNSNDFPTTPGSYQSERPANDYPSDTDAFVTKLNSTGSALVYSTYLGGNDVDRIKGLHIDSGGLVYVAGVTGSDNFPTTPGAYQTSGGLFVSVLNSSCTA